ncbi:MAG TPA: TIGR03617 family F420-dependent LLM class oxidoreductase, partial [Candidatus Dormibacteraeota bacterium]
MGLCFDLPLGFDAAAPAAARAEAQGVDGLWTVESDHDPYLPLAIAATATRRVVLGTAISVAFARSPMVHAMTTWDLHRLAPGRVVLGLGSQVKGHNERRFSVPFERPAARLREMVLAIRAIWRCWQEGSPLDHRGEFYTLTLMTPFFNPGPVEGAPPPPIYLAAINPGMIRITGEVADGLHLPPLTSAETLDRFTLPRLREAAEAAGRDPGAITLVAPAMLATGRTRAEVDAGRERIRSQIGFYGSTRTYRPLLEVHDRGALAGRLHELSVAGRWEELGGAVDDELLDAFCISATWDELPEAMVRRYAGRVHRVMPYGALDPEAPWGEIARAVRSGADTAG